MPSIKVKIPSRLSPVVRRHPRAFVTVLVLVAALMWTAAGASAWFLHGVVTGLPDNEAIRNVGANAQATLLLDMHGEPAFTIFKEQRIDVPLTRVSPHLVHAIVAIEDQRFYEHGGVDVVRIAGAAVNNLREGRRAQGGSTLTQQLARQSFLTPDKTVRRKLKEILVAARLEREFTKAEILQMYLNKVYFGDGLYGAEAAALGYFGKPAAALDVPEAALLAGLVKSPSTYAPTVSPERARERRDVVLREMLRMGALDGERYRDAVAAPVALQDALRREENFRLYFKEEVRRQLVERFGWERVYQGGLKVHTTLDPEAQKAADGELVRALDALDKRRTRGRADAPAEEAPLQAALVAMDPKTGEVRALVGGRDFDRSSFNRATQARRQPGSAFKPFVYAAAIEAGYSPGWVLTNLNDPIMTLEGEWVPEDGHSTADQMTMRAALKTSSNRAAVRMLQEVGIANAAGYAERLGMGKVPRVPSLVLGSGEVTLLSLTAAYGVFANNGVLTPPVLIRKVEEADGEVLYESKTEPQRVIKESTAFLMTTMMADVIDGGTAWTARREGFKLPAAGKTGTTNDYHDAWFVGYTPKLVAGVWVGYDAPRTIMANGYAGELAVPMWSRFMQAATRVDKPQYFPRPRTITTASICRLSGRLASDGCRNATYTTEEGEVVRGSLEYTEYFAAGTEPTDYCPIHAPGGQMLLADDDRQRMPGAIRPAEAPVVVSAPAEPSATPAPKPEEPRKRGFWGRLLGRD